MKRRTFIANGIELGATVAGCLSDGPNDRGDPADDGGNDSSSNDTDDPGNGTNEIRTNQSEDPSGEGNDSDGSMGDDPDGQADGSGYIAVPRMAPSRTPAIHPAPGRVRRSTCRTGIAGSDRGSARQHRRGDYWSVLELSLAIRCRVGRTRGRW